MLTRRHPSARRPATTHCPVIHRSAGETPRDPSRPPAPAPAGAARRTARGRLRHHRWAGPRPGRPADADAGHRLRDRRPRSAGERVLGPGVRLRRAADAARARRRALAVGAEGAHQPVPDDVGADAERGDPVPERHRAGRRGAGRALRVPAGAQPRPRRRAARRERGRDGSAAGHADDGQAGAERAVPAGRRVDGAGLRRRGLPQAPRREGAGGRAGGGRDLHRGLPRGLPRRRVDAALAQPDVLGWHSPARRPHRAVRARRRRPHPGRADR